MTSLLIKIESNLFSESLRDAENKLRSEQIARRIADQNVAELDKEKNLLKVELRDMVDRNKEDGKLIQVVS